MRKLVLGDAEFGEAYTDILPWLCDVDLEELAKCLIDDINGIRKIASTVANGGREDFTLMSHTLTYLCRSSSFDMDLGSVDSLKEAISNVLRRLLRPVASGGYFADYKLVVDHVQISGRSGSIEDMTIVLSLIEEYDYGSRINVLSGELAYGILKAFKNDRGRRTPRRRSR